MRAGRQADAETEPGTATSRSTSRLRLCRAQTAGRRRSSSSSTTASRTHFSTDMQTSTPPRAQTPGRHRKGGHTRARTIDVAQNARPLSQLPSTHMVLRADSLSVVALRYGVVASSGVCLCARSPTVSRATHSTSAVKVQSASKGTKPAQRVASMAAYRSGYAVLLILCSFGAT